MTKKQVLKIVHLYPEEMNIYGDMGNIVTLRQRLEARGIASEYSTIGLKDKKFISGDLYFMGGGQDQDMFTVFEDLTRNKAEFIKAEVAAGKVFLLICGGFQLFGKSFMDAGNKKIPGLGILPLETKAPGDQLADRCLGNILTEIDPELAREIRLAYTDQLPSNTLVGFENHSGQTYFLDDTIKPLAKVLVGKGNNATQKIEGARYGNIFGSYCHGSLLPKNPHLADLLLYLALKNKYGLDFHLEKLDDTVEWLAHNEMRDRLLKAF